MRAFIAVTDNQWFNFLEQEIGIEEVNFWQPREKLQFKAIRTGEIFLFKLHHPDNFIVGGGFFSHSSSGIPCSLVWEWFERKNGVSTLNELRNKIEKYRHIPQHHPQTRYADYKIGSIVLTQPFFFTRDQWITAPSDFHSNIVQGKTYDLTSGLGKELWDAVVERLQRNNSFLVKTKPEAVIFGEPTLIRPRLGQGAFRSLVTDTYQRKCAITQEKVLPVLEAAHLKPVSEGGLHCLDNGILLKRDFHTLFDQGYITITPNYRVCVSKKLKEEFHNGKHYYQFHDTEIWLPPLSNQQPNRVFLEWHADTVFQR